MGLVSLNARNEFTSMVCGSCGIEFFVPTWFDEERLRTGQAWYCPNGHCRIYRETTIQKLQRELEAERNLRRFERGRADRLEGSNRALRGAVTRIKRRVGGGVCPCCKRSFENLKRHMTTKHPEYAAEE